MSFIWGFIWCRKPKASRDDILISKYNHIWYRIEPNFNYFVLFYSIIMYGKTDFQGNVKGRLRTSMHMISEANRYRFTTSVNKDERAESDADLSACSFRLQSELNSSKNSEREVRPNYIAIGKDRRNEIPLKFKLHLLIRMLSNI